MIILSAVVIKAKQGKYSAKNHIGVETGASYWHMVDLVWIILFPLMYIIPMNPILNKINNNIHTIWLLMIALTLFTYVFGKLGYNGLFVTLILLLTAVIKGTLIIRDFMELRDVIISFGAP